MKQRKKTLTIPDKGPRKNRSIDHLLKNCKKVLAEQLAPRPNKSSFPQLNYSVARKAICDFKKIHPDPLLIIDLQLTYVEYGAQCTLAYGDIDATFYDSIERMFRKTLKNMEQHGLLDLFQNRCLAIQKSTCNLGWGFGDAIHELCQEYFPERTTCTA